MVRSGKRRPLARRVSLALMLFTLAACNSGHLSRSKAKSQLEIAAREAQQLNPNGPHSLITQIGTVSGSCYDQTNYDPVEFDKGDAVLLATGYITTRSIKKNVWQVELTQLGQQALGSKYAHTQKPDCDDWQVEFPLSKYDHLNVTGIVEDGVHAKVDASLTFVITPVGRSVMKVASVVVLETEKREETRLLGPENGERLAHEFVDREVATLLGDDLVYAPQNATRYVKQATFAFEKYDDGWKVSKDK